uniref:CDGSH iron-sulfur domain-containing protein 3, mitochondrial n=1 Tax=Oryzias sinensis TaxID=183150 RepID=A0A8C7ZYI7_9TELE
MIPCCSQVCLSTLLPEPVIPSRKPFKVELSGGKHYSWCSCGLSRKQVRHLVSSAGSNPQFYATQEGSAIWLCGCKPTNKPPFCDGTHKDDQFGEGVTGSPNPS